jgi:hypothetical protein
MATKLQRRPPIQNRSGPRKNLRGTRLTLESLEDRLVLSPVIPLDPNLDQFGAQIQTVTQFGTDTNDRVTLGILDTGASPITVASTDQAAFADPFGNPDPVPIMIPGGASASGIGGDVTGDVSQPITVLTDGLHAASFSFDLSTFTFSINASFSNTSAQVDGIQAFVGTDSGSPDLPTISGTPIFAGGFMDPTSTSQLAAKIDLINGVDFYGLGLLEPDVHFLPADSAAPTPAPGELQATIPLKPIGDSNLSSPGQDISNYVNYFADNTALGVNGQTVGGQKFLLDTGSELTIISTAEAAALNLDLNNPPITIDVMGVGGIVTIPGFVLDSLQVPIQGNDTLTFTNVPVFVLDVAPGQIDGLLGMNLMNYTDQMLINPFTPQAGSSATTPTLNITWDPTLFGGGGGGLGSCCGFFLNTWQQGNHGPQGHQGPPTLHELIGGAAREFHVPAQHQASAGVALSVAETPPMQVLSDQATTEMPATLSGSVVPQFTAAFPAFLLVRTAENAGTAPAIPAAPESMVTPTLSLTALAGSGSSFTPSSETLGETPRALATQEKADRLATPAPAPAIDTKGEAGFALPTDAVSDATFARLGRASTDGAAIPSIPAENGAPTDAALVIALGMVVAGFWHLEWNSRSSRRSPALRVEG